MEGGGLEIGSIVGRLVLKDEFSNKLEEGVDKAKKSISGFTLAMGAASGAVLALGAAVMESVKHTAELRDEQTKAARAAGMTTEAYTGLAYAADMSGVSQQVLGKSMRELLDPSDKARAMFERLGVTYKDNNGHLLPQTEILGQLADKFKDMKNPAEKAQAAVQIFGNRASEMTNLLNEGSDGIADLTKKAGELGLVFNDSAGKAAEKYSDDLADMHHAVDGLVQSVGQSIIEFVNQKEIFKEITEEISKLTKWWNELDESTKQTAISIAAGVVVTAALLAAMIAIGAILPILTAGFAALVVAMGPVGVAVLAIGAAVAGLSVAYALLHKSTDEEIASVVRHNESLKESDNVYQRLQGKMKLTRAETEAMAKADKALELAAKAAGVAINTETMSLEEKRKKLEEVKSAQRAQLGLDIVRLYDQIDRIDSEIKMKQNYMKNGMGSSVPGQDEADLKAMIQQREHSIRAVGAAMRAMGDIDRPAETHDVLPGIGDPHKIKLQSEELIGVYERFAAEIRKVAAVKQGLSVTMTGDVDTPEQAEAFKKLVERVKLTAAAIQAAFSTAWNIAQESFNLMITQMQTKITKFENEQKKFDAIAGYALDAMKKQQQAEVDAVQDAWDQKIKIAREAQNQIAAINDAAFQKVKAQMDAEYALFLKNEKAQFNLKLNLIQEQAANQTQAAVDTALMVDDWNKWQSQQDAKHAQEVADAQAASNQQTQDQTAQSNQAIQSMEADKNAELKAMSEQQAKDQKNVKRGIAMFDYMINLQTFAISQQMARAQAKMQLASVIMSAVQAGAGIAAAMSAATLGFGAPIALAVGAATTATLMGIGYAGFASSNAAIASAMPPMPSADVFAADGAVIAGGPSRADDIHAMVSRGEGIVDAGRTQKMIAAIDHMTSQTHESNGMTIHIHGDVMSDAHVEKLAQKVGTMIQRRRF